MVEQGSRHDVGELNAVGLGEDEKKGIIEIW